MRYPTKLPRARELQAMGFWVEPKGRYAVSYKGKHGGGRPWVVTNVATQDRFSSHTLAEVREDISGILEELKAAGVKSCCIDCKCSDSLEYTPFAADCECHCHAHRDVKCVDCGHADDPVAYPADCSCDCHPSHPPRRIR